MQKKSEKQQLGHKGELLAQNFLTEQKHTVIAKNWRFKHCEIDIISIEQGVLVITEVKSYYKPPLGAAELRITKAKQRNIITAAYAFLDENPKYQGFPVRLDVIIVNFSQYPASITQHKSAFYDTGTTW